jgi:hypothetical protein
MSNFKTDFVMRFYGRFVFLQDARHKKDLIVLAVDMMKRHGQKIHSPDKIPTETHNCFLAMCESNVYHDITSATPPSDDFEKPTYRVMATNVVPYDGARALWNLEGCDIDIPSSSTDSGFAWKESWQGAQVANLDDLLKDLLGNDEKRLLDIKSTTTATICLHGGEGRPLHEMNAKIKLSEYEYVRFSDGQSTDKKRRHLADMVEVRIPVSGPHVDLMLTRRNPANGQRPSSMIRVIPNVLSVPDFAGKGLPTTNLPKLYAEPLITFSNLCTASQFGDVDKEFAALYEILDNSPKVDFRKVPKLIDPRIKPDFVPFGDCFLGATISV